MPKSLEKILNRAFLNCGSLQSIYFDGEAADFEDLFIDTDNEAFTNATHYYYSEFMPTDIGNYWHYDADGNIVIWGAE